MTDYDYQHGIRDGKIAALEEMVKQHGHRFDAHEARLRIMERILYGLIGAFALIQLLPTLEKFIK